MDKKLLTNSIFLHYANKTLDWLPMDTEELFNENLKKRKSELQTYGWIDHKFIYKFNSEGFRSDEFSEEQGIVFLGCSHTMGIGIPYENTWPYLVSKSFNKKCYNLSIGGSSNDTAFRLAHHYLPLLNSKTVVFLSTYSHRLELIRQQREILQFFGPGTSPIKNCKFYDTWLSNDTNMEANKLKNILAINMICTNLGIKFICVDQSIMKNLDLARDLAHRGIKSNIELSQHICNLIA